MPRSYKYEGYDYTEDQIQQASETAGLSVDDYINKHGITVSGEEELSSIDNAEPVEKLNDSATAVPSSGSENNMESPLEDGSSDSPVNDPIRYVTVEGVDVYEDEYMQYAGKENYPKTFDEYALAINKEIYTTETVDLNTKRNQINIDVDVAPKNLQQQLLSQGFTSKTIQPSSKSLGRGAPAVYVPGSVEITAANGNVFSYNKNGETSKEDLNEFLNNNKPTGGYAKEFIQEHGYTASDLNPGLVNGAEGIPDYQFLDVISKRTDTLLQKISGLKTVGINDKVFNYNDYFSLAEDPNLDREGLRTGVIDKVVESLYSKGDLDPENTDPNYVRELVKEIVNKNNYLDAKLETIKYKQQANQELELGGQTLTDNDRKSFQDARVSGANENLRERYRITKNIDGYNKEITNLTSQINAGLYETQEALANKQSRVLQLISLRDSAFEALKDTPIAGEETQLGQVINNNPLVYSTSFTGATGGQVVSEEDQKKLYEDFLKQKQEELLEGAEKESIGSNGSLTTREALGVSYDNTIKEIMWLDGWTRAEEQNTKLNFSKVGKSVSDYVKGELGAVSDDTVTLNDALVLEKKLRETYGNSKGAELTRLLLGDDASKINTYYSQRQSLDLKLNALDNIYLYNINPADLEKNKLDMFFSSAIVATIGPEAGEKFKLWNNSNRFKLDNIQEYFDSYSKTFASQIEAGVMPPISLDKKQMEALDRSFWEDVTEASGGMMPVLAEFAILNYATAGLFAATGFARVLDGLKNSTSIVKKMQHSGLQMILEGAKFSVIDGESSMVKGGTFSGVNQLFSLAPGLSGKASFFNGLIRNFFGTGISGATAINAAEVSSQLQKSFSSDEDFSNFVEENFTGENAEFGRKFLVDAISFSLLGPASIKKENLSWKEYQGNTLRYRSVLDQSVLKSKILQEIKNNPEKAEQLKRDYGIKDSDLTDSAITELQGMIGVMTPFVKARDAAFKINVVSNPEGKSNVSKYVNQQLKSVQKEGETTTVKFVDSAKDMPGAGSSDTARWVADTNTMYFVTGKFDAGVMMHEITHAIEQKYLELAPGEVPVFNQSMLKALEKSFGLKGEELRTAINKEYNIDLTTKEGGVESDREFIAYAYQMLTSKTFAEDFGIDRKAQTFMEYVKSEVTNFMINAGVPQRNITPETIYRTLSDIGELGASGRDVSRQIKNTTQALIEGKVNIGVVEGEGKGGQSAKDILDSAYKDLEIASDLYEQGKISSAEYEIAEKRYVQSINKASTAADLPTSTPKFDNEALIEVIRNPNATRVDKSRAEAELLESFDTMALAAIKYDTRKGDIDRTEIRDYLRQYFPRILEKWDPKVSKFSTWVTNNIKYKAQAAYETFKNSDTVSIDVQAGEIGSVAELAATSTSSVYETPVSEVRGTVPARLLPPNVSEKVTTAVTERLKNVDLTSSSLRDLEGASIDVLAEWMNIPVEKLTDPNKNLTQENRYQIRESDGSLRLDKDGEPVLLTEYQFENALKITPEIKKGAVMLSEAESIRISLAQLGDKIINLFPDLNIAGQMIDGKPVGEGDIPISGLSINIPKAVQNAFYDLFINPETGKPYRGKNPTSQTPIKKLETLSYQDFLKTINKIRGHKFERPEGVSDKEWLKIQRDNGQVLKGVVLWFDKMITNEIARRTPGLTANVINNLSAGKPPGMAAKPLPAKNKASLNQVANDYKNGLKDQDNQLLELEIADKLIEIANTPDITNEGAVSSLLEFTKEKLSATDFKKWTQLNHPLLKNIINTGEIMPKTLLEYIGEFRKIYVYEQQKAGYDQSKRDLEYRLQKIQNSEDITPEDKTEAQGIMVNSWLKNFSRIGVNYKFDGTTNKQVLENVLFPLFEKGAYIDLAKSYDILTSKRGNSHIVYNGEVLKGYLNPTQIKADFTGSKGDMIADSKASQIYVKDTLTGLAEAGKTYQALNLIEALKNDQRGALRKTYRPGFELKNLDPNQKTKYILEHEPPIQDLVEAIKKWINNPSVENKKAWEHMFEIGRINLIPKDLDKILNSKENLASVPSGGTRYDGALYIKAAEKYQLYPETSGMAAKSISPITISVNTLLRNLGKISDVDISETQARILGQKVDDNYIPLLLKGKREPSSMDFLDLMQQMTPKGKEGDAWAERNNDLFTRPYNRAYQNLDAAETRISSNYKNLKNNFKIKDSFLQEKIGNSNFRNEDALRVYVWSLQDIEVPGLSMKEKTNLLEHVRSNKNLRLFAAQVSGLNKGFGFTEPKDNWISGSLSGDLYNSIQKLNRKSYLQEWQTNVDAYFTPGNMKLMEATLGTKWRYAMENSLLRQQTGENRYYGVDGSVGKFADQLSGAVLNTLSLNNKSALLQLTSSLNYVNFTDNNPFNAAKAFANQTQYWGDFNMLMQTDFLKQRRSGLKMNLSDSDVADLSKKGGFAGLTAKLLKLGMAPTVIADNIAIAGGGATFYRNRLNTYKKNGLAEFEAKKKALEDWRQATETSQQSSRPDKISMQQAGPLGRIVLAYTNTPQQYFREMSKSYSDLINNRGDKKTNISKIAYYGFAQNLMFTSLQQGLKSAMFEDDPIPVPQIMTDIEFRTYLNSLEPENRRKARKERDLKVKEVEEIQAKNKNKINGNLNTINGMLDTTLNGMGIAGRVFSTIKNAGFKAYLESQKDNPNYSGQVPVALLGISPGLSTKFGQIQRGLNAFQFNEEEIKARGLGDWNNPAYEGAADILAGITNIPLNRLYRKTVNMSNAFNEEYTTIQRIMSAAGWSEYSLGIEKEKWQDFTDLEMVNMDEWNKKQLLKLSPENRGLFLKMQREYKKRQKEKNKK